MTELGRFLPLTRVGVSKNYVRNDVITAKNCFVTLLANINTEVCQPWQETTQRVGKISTVQTHSPWNSHAQLFRAGLLINYSLNI